MTPPAPLAIVIAVGYRLWETADQAAKARHGAWSARQITLNQRVVLLVERSLGHIAAALQQAVTIARMNAKGNCCSTSNKVSPKSCCMRRRRQQAAGGLVENQ